MTQSSKNQSPQDDLKINCACTTQRGIARHQKLLEVASRAFLEQGYAGANINDIVKEAGGSLGTLYRLFKNKVGLFEAVLKLKTHEIFNEFESDDVWTDDIETSLYRFCAKLQQSIINPDSAAFYRLVLSVNGLDKEKIQNIFYLNGPLRANKILSKYLAKQVAEHKLDIENCDIAAYQLLEMVKGPFFLRSQLNIKISESEKQQALTQGIKIFLKGTQITQNTNKNNL